MRWWVPQQGQWRWQFGGGDGGYNGCKTQIRRHWENGSCKNGSSCNLAHGEVEIGSWALGLDLHFSGWRTAWCTAVWGARGSSGWTLKK